MSDVQDWKMKVDQQPANGEPPTLIDNGYPPPAVDRRLELLSVVAPV